MMQGWTWTESDWTRTIVLPDWMDWNIGWGMFDYLKGVGWRTTIVGSVSVDQVTGYWNDGTEEWTELD